MYRNMIGGVVEQLADSYARVQGRIGEQRVRDVLSPLETEGYEVVHGLDTGRGDVDHVVLGPTGVFVIETKAWNGRVYPAKDGRLMCNERDETRSVRQVLSEMTEVKKRLRGAGIEGWVGAIIVLTHATLWKRRIGFPGVNVLRAEHVCAYIRAGRGSLTPDEIARGRKAIAGRTPSTSPR